MVIIGIAAIAFLVWEPQVEGCNQNADNFEIYFKDPFLAFAYIGSLPFFISLYHVYGILRHVRELRTNSTMVLAKLTIIKRCAYATIGFVLGGEVIILMSESDDRAGGFFMGFLVATGSILVIVITSRYIRKISEYII